MFVHVLHIDFAPCILTQVYYTSTQDASRRGLDLDLDSVNVVSYLIS